MTIRRRRTLRDHDLGRRLTVRAADDARVPSCVVPPRDPSLLARARAFVACRPCAIGWVAYLVVAILLVVFAGTR
jgi:hypothetical protein